ncbi:hypothetical protein EJB05_11591, partial [Eragrostis curvula]
MEVAKAVTNLQILALFMLCLCATASSQSRSRPFRRMMPGPFIPHDHTRSADVARQCQSVLSSAAELKVEADDVHAMMHQLSFTNGDWSQDDAAQAPLMPFEGSYADTSATDVGPLDAVRLASFMLTHVDAAPRRRGARTAVNVSGCVSFTVTRDQCCRRVEPRVSPEFELGSGFATLDVVFEGVYTETMSSASAGGERVLCMVGNAVLPVRGGNGSGPWDWAKAKNGDEKPPVTADGNILLVLRYPKEHKLTTRAVLGEMTSTSAKSSSAYFDTVRLVSRLGHQSSPYQFRSEEELDVSAGCIEHPSLFDDGGGGTHLYRGASFCDFLELFTPGDNDVLAVVPNWRCDSSDDEVCSRLGPFDAPATGGAFSRSAIALLDLQCEPTTSDAARVSAVFRVVPPREHHMVAARRTGLSGTTMSAEGVWSASTGRLCMVGCLGVGEDACHHRMSMHVATAFSITRRGIIVGGIASTNGSHRSPPLLFQQRVSAGQSWNRFGQNEESVRMVYEYTKVEQAMELHRKRKPSWFRDNFIARSLLSYPSVAGAADDVMSLSELAGDLSIRFQCVPKLPFLPQWVVEPIVNFHLQILSTGPLVGTYSPPKQRGYAGGIPATTKTQRSHGGEQHRILNVSAYLTVSGPRGTPRMFSGRAVMTLEGVYSPEDGRMYLIGCRNVEAPWRVSSSARRHLEDGMDCSIEVVVEYPPTTTRWLVSPAAKVYFASSRDADDPLYFNRTELRSPPINYRDQRDVLTEHVVESLLCVSMLSATIAASVGQLRHVKSHADVAPYVSLATLGVQALGYGVTLVTDAKMLPAWPNYHHVFRAGYLHWDMDSSIRALTLAALLLTARLAQKVRRARARARVRSPLEPGRVPSDGAVVLYTVVIHLCGLLFVLALHWLSSRGVSLTREERAGASRLPPSQMRTAGAVVERYIGVVKEWFLLPQVVGNAVWRVNCKPLAKKYYAGVTAVWLLPHVYGYLRPPTVYMQPEIRNDVMDLCANAFDVVVPVVGVALALAVYLQQRWNYKIVGWTTKTEWNKLQHAYVGKFSKD